MISVEEFLARTGIPVPPADETSRSDTESSATETSAAESSATETTAAETSAAETLAAESSAAVSAADGAGSDAGRIASASVGTASYGSASHGSASYGTASFGSASFGSAGSESRDSSRFGKPTGKRASRGRGRSRRSGRRGPRELGEDEARDVDMCQEAALTLLDAAARSTGAMEERLARKGYAPDTIATVIANLTRVGLLNDESYAEDAVRYCLTRCMGRRGTVAELVRKGVDRHLADRVTREAEEQGLFVDSAYRLGRQVAGRTEGLDRAVRLRRFWSAGGRKGHSPADLRAVVDDGVFDDGVFDDA